MKLPLLILCLLLGFTAVSCSENEVEPEIRPEENKAPSVPLLQFPSEDLTCSYSSLTFQWSDSRDPEAGSLTYELQISAAAPDFSALSQQKVQGGTSVNINLESGTIYYWRVRARDEKGMASDFSKVWSFSTEPSLSYNNLPYQARLVHPDYNAALDQDKVLLEWLGEDKDGDALISELYFGTTNPPELYQEDIETKEVEVSLEKGNTYYWKVNLEDGKGAKTIGRIWKFTS